jgi:hypothetical protein
VVHRPRRSNSPRRLVRLISFGDQAIKRQAADADATALALVQMFKPRRNEEHEENPQEGGSKLSFVFFVSSWFVAISAVPI